jgi:hypothetical protein
VAERNPPADDLGWLPDAPATGFLLDRGQIERVEADPAHARATGAPCANLTGCARSATTPSTQTPLSRPPRRTTSPTASPPRNGSLSWESSSWNSSPLSGTQGRGLKAARHCSPAPVPLGSLRCLHHAPPSGTPRCLTWTLAAQVTASRPLCRRRRVGNLEMPGQRPEVRRTVGITAPTGPVRGLVRPRPWAGPWPSVGGSPTVGGPLGPRNPAPTDT